MRSTSRAPWISSGVKGVAVGCVLMVVDLAWVGQTSNERDLSGVVERRVHVFFFYNSRWGCVGSLLVSAALTLLVLFLLGWI